jgi:hypothetical protein
MRDNCQTLVQCSVYVAAFYMLFFGSFGLSATVASPMPGAPGIIVRIAESAGSESNVSGGSANGRGIGGSNGSKLSSKQLSRLNEALQAGRKGEVHILWLEAASTQGEQIQSTFRKAGWAVASMPIGMGNLPSGITITGSAKNLAVAAAKSAFDRSGIQYRYRDDATRTISPENMGPCDLAITISTESE